MIVLFVIIMYFVPGVIAGFRGHKNATAITILNLFLGWTFLGWVIALVWAFTNPVSREVVYLPPSNPNRGGTYELEQGTRRELPQTSHNPNLK